MRVETYQPFHVELLKAQGVQASQLRAVSHVPEGYASLPKPPGPSVTAFDGDKVIICGGIIPMGFKRGICWALLSEEAAKHMLFLHRAVTRFISMQDWSRLEATVEEGFGPGCKWVELLGFKFEGKMLKYGEGGETHLRYAKT